MRDEANPSQRYNPDQIILHTGSNDLPTPKTAEEMSDEIIKLSLELKTDENDIIVGDIIGRNDEHNEKVNGILNIKCNTL